jgi:hypothetical protein
MDWNAAARWVHVLTGYGAFGFGLVAALLPKFGRGATWHRWIGRGYATCMLISSGLSIPIAARVGNTVLLVIGLLTFPAAAAAWIAIRRRRSPNTSAAARRRLLRSHMVLMGASYIAAWTAFLLNNPIFGDGTPWHRYFYMFGPTVIGSAAISIAAHRHRSRLTASGEW